MNFRFDLISFLIGMAVATVVWWLISLLRPIIERWFESLRAQRLENEQKRRSGLEGDYLQAIYKLSQGMHLAGSLFPLDEIAEAPRLLAPPIIFEPNTPHQHLDIVEDTLPYLPDYPELGGFYDAPSLSPLQAISGGLNLAIIGQPGSGKSTALACVAAQLSKTMTDSETGPEYIPFLIHAADLGAVLTGSKPRDVLSPIADRTAPILKNADGARFRRFMEYSYSSGRALLLMDGVDELPQAAIKELSTYLEALLQRYPKIHIILAASPEYVDGLGVLGFVPMALMPWNLQQQTHFIKTWGELWQKYLNRESWAQQLGTNVDPLLLNRWLVVDNFSLSPLEFTLKLWGAYAGDTRSSNPLDTLEAHLKRLTPAGISLDIISTIATQAITNEISIFDGNKATDWIKSIGLVAVTESSTSAVNPFTAEANEEIAKEAAAQANSEGKPDPIKPSSQAQQLSNISVISELTISGLLNSHTGNRLRFSHPIFLGYLAGKKLSEQPSQSETVMNQKSWLGQSQALRFMAAAGDVAEIVNKLLTSEDPILMRPILKAGRLLKDSNLPQNNSWRALVIAALVKLLNDEDRPFGLRGQAMMALALSGDNKIGALFRQLLQAESNDLRLLAALGSGLVRDQKAIEMLEHMTTTSLEAARRAACLALVEIGTSQALEAVAVFLLHGDEQIRTYAAEALANNHKEGREALREGIASEDILVRRAIIYGLARVEEPWATELLEKSQVNDEQWAVRNLAVEILTTRQERNLRIPKLLTVPHETTWLIEFAGKYGMGVSPSQPAINILLLALKDSNPDYFRPALNYLKYYSTDEIFAALYPFIFGIDMSAREAVFETITYIARGGSTLPPPRQFGLG